MEQSKSKQLNSISTITQKCIKIITVLSESTSSTCSINTNELTNDPFDSISCLLDEILNVVSLSYGSISMESMLQKQENLNRGLIRKELLFREENESISEELESKKKQILKLDQKIDLLKEEIKDKDLTILHLKNELRVSQKERQFFDDCKMMNAIDKKLKSTMSKEIEKEIVKNSSNSIHRLGNHNRRKSEDTSRKVGKKDKKERSESTNKNIFISSHKICFQK